ncbi:MAG: hypothetical protein ACUVV6_07520 [Thermoplasmatota archaeon]
MRGAHFIIAAGGFFKRRKEAPPSRPSEEAEELEEAIRKKVKNELRAREDAVNERETKLNQKEAELNKKATELAHKLQELAEREAKLEGRSPGAGGGTGGEATQAAAQPAPFPQDFPPDQDDPAAQAELITRLENRLDAARAKHAELVERERKRAEYRDRIEGYRSRGLSVDRLEAVIGESIDDVEMAFECYENDLAQLARLAERCDRVDRVFAAEADALKARCSDPDAIPEIEAGLRELELRIEAKRREVLERVQRWADAGYVVSRLQELRDSDLSTLEQALMHFEEDVEVLKMFGERLASMDPAFEAEATQLKTQLTDPSRIPDIETQLLAIEQKIGLRKQEFVNRLAGYKAEGWVTDSLDAVMSSDLATIEKAFMKFDEDTRKLGSLAERAFKLDRFFTPQIAAITDNLRNPAQIPQIEARIQAIEEETERRRADFRIRIDALKAEGINTTVLENAMSGDLESISSVFAEYDSDQTKLQELLPRVAAIESEGRHLDELNALRARFKEPGARGEIERRLAELEELIRAEKKRETEERVRKEMEAAEKRSREEMERERAERERAERERLEKAQPAEEAAAAPSPGLPPPPPAPPAPSAPQPPEAPQPSLPPSPVEPGEAGRATPEEQEVSSLIASAEALIKELEAAKLDVTFANSHLKLARSFFRRKKLDKALYYVKKAHETASALRK